MSDKEKDEVVKDEYVDTPQGTMRVAISKNEGLYMCDNNHIIKLDENGRCPHCGSTMTAPFALLDPD